ncbi:Por secretion system C-terminal sorting domain-containing protein [Dyadobacter sp. SG02]|uniref:T9SS type A sorting domain-containing protein n=1 Tax=Dyadobacter sp. SG02 TaxID=1855291 RepID=UPI0008ABA73E|nr:T9SS type A sorting domain-containing protein [Dyadobacter sp. SG02]SEJ22581.1 Por secretion system C-terminal sorting domain-containing protein [Dyadobacter sp. SG02]
MRKLYFTIALNFLSVCLWAQCPPDGDITLSTQAEVNAFGTSYAGCSNLTIAGDLTIEGADITDLTPLLIIDAVDGDLRVYSCDALSSLAGLNGLVSIGEKLDINSNASLTALTGLAALNVVGGINIASNAALTDLSALAGVTSLSGGLTIDTSDALASLNGLHNITSVGDYVLILNLSALASLSELNINNIGGDLRINDMDILTDLSGIGTFTSIGGALDLSTNPLLESLDGLEAVTSIGGDVLLNFNSSLQNITALSALESVGGSIHIFLNPALTSLSPLSLIESVPGYLMVLSASALSDLNGLHNITTVGDYVLIQANPGLVDLTGLTNLLSVANGITISENENLTSLTGLAAITTVGGGLSLSDNSSLTDISALSGISSLGSLVIKGNPLLADLTGLDHLTSIQFDLDIQLNDLLEDLSALSGLTSSMAGVTLASNPLLANIEGLKNITGFSDYVYINDNPSLNHCAIPAVCLFLSGSAVPGSINLNAGDCATTDDVLAECGSLPVTLISFAGKKEESKTKLVWATSTEVNSDFFEVQHSLNPGKNWIPIGTVATKGSPLSKAAYDFVHDHPAGGINYYRLKMVDKDGSFAFSKIVAVTFAKTTGSWLAYPNPVKDRLTIDTRSDHDIVRFEVISSSGIKVYDSPGSAVADQSIRHIDLRGKPAGTYLLRATRNHGERTTRHIIKE